MTEKEKMLSGVPYQPFDEELLQDRRRAREVLYELNRLHPAEEGEIKALVRGFFGKIGEAFFIERPFLCDYGYNIEAGDRFFANYNCVILDAAKVVIGDNVMFAPNVSLFTAGHPTHHVPRSTGVEYALPITIGDNVWLGGNVVVNPGVSIGECTVVGSGSVVAKDLPPGVVAAGNPCRVLRKILPEEKEIYARR